MVSELRAQTRCSDDRSLPRSSFISTGVVGTRRGLWIRPRRIAPTPDGTFAGVSDVLGDGSLWGIWVPGHTPGSVAFLARTPGGPVLLTGDACHTAWGWKNGVAPGTFSDDVEGSADSLARLEAFVARHPKVEVRLGHQELR
jgi:glyoxylase-like metal-dependent hydrolase (beta-lactamase superfamily II)